MLKLFWTRLMTESVPATSPNVRSQNENSEGRELLMAFPLDRQSIVHANITASWPNTARLAMCIK
jgi:hypothetical protein